MFFNEFNYSKLKKSGRKFYFDFSLVCNLDETFHTDAKAVLHRTSLGSEEKELDYRLILEHGSRPGLFEDIKKDHFEKAVKTYQYRLHDHCG